VVRTATADREISGCPVRAGSRAVLSLQSANLDDEAWGPDAAEFALDRNPRQATSTTFGHGIHTCLGSDAGPPGGPTARRGAGRALPGMRLAPGYSWHAARRFMVRRPARLDVILQLSGGHAAQQLNGRVAVVTGGASGIAGTGEPVRG
jgi:hypothetical protein